MASPAVSMWGGGGGGGEWEPSEGENEGDLGKKAGEHFSSLKAPPPPLPLFSTPFFLLAPHY